MRKIEVLIYRDPEERVTGFQISGHSNYRRRGNDILCSAVSILAENTVNSIEVLTDDKPDILAVNEAEGFLHYRLKTVSEKSELILQSFVLGLQKIEEEYGRYITIGFTEESSC